MNQCKFCGMLSKGPLAAQLPNLILETDRATVFVNRRPIAPGHVTVILKTHLAQTGAMTDATWLGVGSLVGRVASTLEQRFNATRVIFLGDGKPSAHVHLHLIPDPKNRSVAIGEAVADLNQADRPATLSPEEVSAMVNELRAALAAS